MAFSFKIVIFMHVIFIPHSDMPWPIVILIWLCYVEVWGECPPPGGGALYVVSG